MKIKVLILLSLVAAIAIWGICRFTGVTYAWFNDRVESKVQHVKLGS